MEKNYYKAMEWWVPARVLALVGISMLGVWATSMSLRDAAAQDDDAVIVRVTRGSVVRSAGCHVDVMTSHDKVRGFMSEAAASIQRQLYPPWPSSRTAAAPSTWRRKSVKRVSLSFEDGMSWPAVSVHNHLLISASHVALYHVSRNDSDDLALRALIHTAMAHVWLWDGSGQAPLWLLHGMAGFLTRSAGLWLQPEDNHRVTADNVDHPCSVYPSTAPSLYYSACTVGFMQFCEDRRPGFVASLNAKLSDGWDYSFFLDLTGTAFPDLWAAFLTNASAILSKAST